MNRWLEDFAFKITIGAGVFIIAVSMAIVIVWVTVSIKSMQAALANPVDSIRVE